MVRLAGVLFRTPVIKFRKGGLSASGHSGSAPGPTTSQAATVSAASPAASQMQTASPMSTASIPDIDLPPRYRRMPMSQEEMDHINGGGIV